MRLGTRGIALHRDTGKLKKTVWDVYVAGTSGAAIHVYRDTAEEDSVAGCVTGTWELPCIEARLKKTVWAACVSGNVGSLPCMEARLKKAMCSANVSGNKGVSLHRDTTEEDNVGWVAARAAGNVG